MQFNSIIPVVHEPTYKAWFKTFWLNLKKKKKQKQKQNLYSMTSQESALLLFNQMIWLMKNTLRYDPHVNLRQHCIMGLAKGKITGKTCFTVYMNMSNV